MHRDNYDNNSCSVIATLQCVYYLVTVRWASYNELAFGYTLKYEGSPLNNICIKHHFVCQLLLLIFIFILIAINNSSINSAADDGVLTMARVKRGRYMGCLSL